MKRPFANVESQDDDGSRAGSSPFGGPGFNPKRRKQFRTGKNKAREGSLAFSKKRARNIERLLQRQTNLPANVQNDLERELAAHRATVSDREFQKQRSSMISRYHMVRFFERQKASRLVKQLKRKLEQTPEADDAERLKRQLHVAEVDEAYAIYHPHLEPYNSLYGSTARSKEDKDDDNDGEEGVNQSSVAKAALEAERPPLWRVVEEAMDKGVEALEQLRERRSADDQMAKTKPRRALGPVSSADADQKTGKQQSGLENGDDDEEGEEEEAGGFFEGL
ncbi:hypothetical protein UVI_02026000 [Ustilaginoidea virens]|uniref:rRNA-processing protein EFG1 n=1 Tax=Ustilaginoidea virens TaxID=1159556 RepID=A0A1B5KR94_USTVR|nr:hypothetical protein UVI_02026000 [Ustilaginoidea virens]